MVGSLIYLIIGLYPDIGFSIVRLCQVQFTLEMKVCKIDSDIYRLVEWPWCYKTRVWTDFGLRLGLGQ